MSALHGCSSIRAADTAGNQGDAGDPARAGEAGAPGADGAAADAAIPVFSERLCSAGFCWELPKPQGNALNAVSLTAEDDVWAAGGGGALLHGQAGAWLAASSGQPGALRGIWAASDSDVWAVGDAGVIVHFDGTSLTTVPSGTTETLFGIWGLAHDSIWAVGGSGSILFYDGSAWKAQGNAHDEMHAVWGSGPNDVWAVGGTLNVSTTAHWDGKTWTAGTAGMSTAGLNAVDGVGGTVMAVGEYGEVWSLPGLNLVGRIDPNTQPKLTALRVLAANDVYAASRYATYHYDGSAWTTLSPTAGGLALASAPGSKAVWIAGGGGAIGRLDRPHPEIAPAGILATYVHDDANAYVLSATATDGSTSDVLHFDGSSWTKVGDVAGLAYTCAIGGTTDGKLLVVGAPASDASVTPSVVKVYDGTSWTTLPESPLAYLPKIAGSSARDVWFIPAAGQDGNGELSHYDGSAWTKVQLPGATEDGPLARAIYVLGPNAVFVAGVMGTGNKSAPYLASYDGSSWTGGALDELAVVTVDSVWATAPDDVWVSGVFTDSTKPRDEGFVYYPTQPVLFHRKGTTVTREPVPPPLSIAAYHSASNAWVAGTSADRMWMVLAGDTQLPGNSYAWDGKNWTARPCPAADISNVWLTAGSAWVLSAGGMLRAR